MPCIPFAKCTCCPLEAAKRHWIERGDCSFRGELVLIFECLTFASLHRPRTSMSPCIWLNGYSSISNDPGWFGRDPFRSFGNELLLPGKPLPHPQRSPRLRFWQLDV